MAEFNELIRSFDKIRDYIRDFYIYGFKSRTDFTHKSARTYDNERRRIESYMGEYMKWDYSKSGKTAFISMDCAKVPVNPLYAAWKSKAFTANDIMLHFYILDVLTANEVFSLEDGILLDLLSSIRKGEAISFVNYSEKRKSTSTIEGIPLKIFVSASTGRRYLCLYRVYQRRFSTYRLDHIKSVTPIGECPEIMQYREKLQKNIDRVWGVGFGGRSRLEVICMKLYIREGQEDFILDRIHREGKGGELLRLEPNIYFYTKEVYDSSDVSPWIKTFTGRIIQLEGTNDAVINRFYNDINRMKAIYGIEESTWNYSQKSTDVITP